MSALLLLLLLLLSSWLLGRYEACGVLSEREKEGGGEGESGREREGEGDWEREVRYSLFVWLHHTSFILYSSH